MPQTTYQKELKRIRTTSQADAAVVANLLEASSMRKMRPPPRSFLASFTSLGVDAEATAEGVSRAFGNVGLSRHHYEDLQFALVVLGFIVRHCATFNRHPDFKTHQPKKNEKRFQKHVADYLKGLPEFSKLCELTEHTAASGGYTDLVISSVQSGRRPVVVELKSAKEGYEAQYTRHAGQPQQYAEGRYGRVTILYVQYQSNSAVRVADTIRVRQNENTGSKQVTICIGQRAFAQAPSQGGATTTAADPSG